MDNKKRMMFILEEDYYFITIKLLSVLLALGCDKKPFEDYRKLGVIFEFIKTQENVSFFEKIMSQKADSIFDHERVIKFFCDSKLNVSVIKRILFFLEKQGMVELQKSKKNSHIDVLLIVNKEIEELTKSDMLKEDVKRASIVIKTLPRIRSMKLSTLQERVFGYNEVAKWDD